MSMVTVANRALAVRRLKVPNPASRWCLPSFFFSAASESLEIQATMGLGLEPWVRMLTTPWMALTKSSL